MAPFTKYYKIFHQLMIKKQPPWSEHFQEVHDEMIASHEGTKLPKLSTCKRAFYDLLREQNNSEGEVGSSSHGSPRSRTVSHGSDDVRPAISPVPQRLVVTRTRPTADHIRDLILREQFVLAPAERRVLLSTENAIYPSVVPTRPLALCFINYRYSNNRYRYGAYNESVRIEKYLLAMGYNVRVIYNKNAESIQRRIREFCNLQSHSSRCLLYFSAHGSHAELECADNEFISYRSIAQEVGSSAALAGKAKIIIFACCRLFDATDIPLPPSICNARTATHHLDVVILWSTSLFHPSGRDTLWGQEFTKVWLDSYQSYSRRKDYSGMTIGAWMEIMTNRFSSHGIPQYDENNRLVEVYSQVPEYQAQLRGPLYLPVVIRNR